MLNEERVILMTQMAAYEQGEGKKNVRIGSYFRSDYISAQILKSIISGTIVFCIAFALYIFYGFETFMQNLYKMDLFAFAKTVLKCYAISVASYSLLTYIVSTYQYVKAKSSLKAYYHNLKKLSSLYGEGNGRKNSAGGNK